MIFDTPDLRSGTGYPGDPATLGEVVEAHGRGQYHIESVNALNWQLEEEYTSRIKAIKDAGGGDVPHPLETEPNVDRLMARARQRGRHWFNNQDILEIQLEEAAERLEALQQKHPELANIIRADAPPHLDVYRRMRRIEGERADVDARRGLDSISGMLTDPLGTGAMFVGSLWGMRHSPVDLLALVAGGAAGRPAFSLLRNALINATANAAAQALVEPGVQSNRAMAGLEAGWGPALGNIAMAFGMGGTLDLAVRTPGRAYRWWQGQPNVGGFFRDAPPVTPRADTPLPQLPEISEDLISRAREGDVQAMTDIAEMVTGQPVPMPEGVTREMVGKALQGDQDALVQVIQRSGLTEDPAIKGALDRAMLEGDNAEIQSALQRVRDEFAQISTPEGGRIDIDVGQDEQRILQALRAAMDPEEPTPTGGMDLAVARRAALADDEPLPRGTAGTNQHELKLDIFGRPAAVREIDLKLARLEGEVEALRARQWSPDLAGRVLAFEPREGQLLIMDGRRRAELAQRVQGDARAEAVVFREADGWTQKDVAALAKRKNIAEGKGSPVELAESLRASPDLLDLIDPDTLVTRTARSLAMLSDDAFGMVKAGDADPRMAAMVSDMVGNEALHAQLLRDLKAAGIEDLTQARRSLNDLLPYTGAHEANATLLGFEPDEMPLRAGADVDDPKGPAAKAQVQRLEQELAPEIADARAKGPPAPTPAETAAEAVGRANAVRAAIEQVVGRFPDDLRVETFSAIGDLPDGLRAEVMRGNAVAFSNALQRVQAARTPAARARALADLEAAKRGEGVEGFERDGVVYVATYAVNPDAVLHHEIVHWLSRTGRITDQEIALLAKRARKEGLFDEGLYREAMAGRENLDARLDEEAAAHLMQARKEGRSFGRKADSIIDKALRTLEMIGNALRGYGFRTADDVVEAVLSGEMARREAVQAVMRADDVTSAAAKGDAMFAFAGERARTADLDALNRAKDMETQGKDRTAIWHATGWFKGVDGKWRFEIDDSQASAEFGGPTQLSNLLKHPRLLETYPQLGELQSEFIEGRSGAGQFSGGHLVATGGSPESLLRVALHEVQHAIQRDEGTARGGAFFSARDPRPAETIEAARSAYADEARRLFAEAAELIRADRFDEGNALQARAYALEQLAQDMTPAGRGAYRRLAGEVEARAVEKRLTYTPEERKARPPWEDYDVPEDQQIVRMGDGAMFSLRSEEVAPGIRTRPWVDTPPPMPGTVVRGETMFAIRAFHGSPHDFDRFSLEKIGTGEGAQAFGHGLYFAESEGVAKSYRDALADGDWTVGGKPYDPSNPEHFAAATLAEYPSAEAAVRSLKVRIAKHEEINADWNKPHIERYRDVIRRIERGDLPRLEETSKGRLYEVRINAEPEELLHWDKPLSEQPPTVRAAIDQLRAEFRDQIDAIYEMSDDAQQAWGSIDPKKLEAILAVGDDAPASQLHQAMRRAFPDDQTEAADRLLDLGIRGIRYLDGASRTAGEGTYNYVVFDDSLIEITAKDGKPVSQQEASDVLATSRSDGIDDAGPMFSLRQEAGTPPPRPDIDIPALAQRLIGIADTYRAAVSGERLELPDAQSLSLGRSEDGLITSVDVGGETYFVARDETGNITGLLSPEQATERAIADTIQTTARGAGYDLDPERVSSYTAEAMAIVRTAQDDPQGALQSASDLMARISDEITPDEPAIRADNDNEIPTPLRQDLADVDRLNDHAELVSVCRI